MKRRSLSFFLVFSIIISLLPFGVVAANIIDSGTCGNNLTWTVTDDGILKISGDGDMDAPIALSPKNWYKYKDQVTKVIIESGVTSIDTDAFRGFEKLTVADVPSSVVRVGHNAFYDTALYNDKSNWEDGVLYVGPVLADSKTSIESCIIKDGTSAIANDSFWECKKLKSIYIPSSVESIGSNVFYHCTNLKNITISEGVSTIFDAFVGCSSLKNIDIPSSVKSIHRNAFWYCTSLETINVHPNNSVFSSDNGLLLNKDGTKLLRCPEGKAGNCQIPNGVTSIENYALNYCSKLTSVSLPKGVTNIGEFAFCECNNLANITIPDGVSSIGDSSFFKCTSLNNLTLPESLSYIGNAAFYDCSALTSIVIPCNIDAISPRAFANCSNLTHVKIPHGVTNIGDDAFKRCENLVELKIPDSVTQIGGYAFSYCEKLETVKFPIGITSLGYGSFQYCYSLKDVTIPESATQIDGRVFSNCSSLANIIIPNSVTKIGASAFLDCSSLISVIIPESVTHIGESAFLRCSSLAEVYYKGTEAQWDQIKISVGNDPLLNASIHFNSSGPSSPISPTPSDEHYMFYPLVTSITCNEYGDDYLPVAITDKKGNLVDDGTVFFYSAPGVDGKNVSSSKGVIYLPFYGSDDAGNAEFCVRKYESGTGKIISEEIITIKTVTKPLSYTEKIKTDLSLNGEGKLADVLGLSSAELYGTGFEYEEDNGAGKLTLSNKYSGKIGGGLGTPKKLIASVEGSGKITAEEETAFTIEGFDPKSALHKGLVGYYLLQQWNFGKVTQTELTNSFREMYGVDPDGYRDKSSKEIATVKVDADVPILKTLLGDLAGGYDITSPGGALTYESSVKHEPGVSETYTSKIKADFHGFLSKGPWLMGISSTIFCNDLDGRSIAVTAKDYVDDSKDSISFSSDAYTSDVVAGWTEKDTTVSKVTFSGETAKLLFQNNYVIPSLLKGTAYFLTPNELRGFMTRAESIVKEDPLNHIASYSEEVKYTSDFEYSYGSGSDGKIDTYIGLTGTGEKEYTIPTKTGVVFNGDKYLTTDTSFPEGTTWNLGYSVPEMFGLYADGLLSFFGKCIAYEAGKVVDGVVEGAAKVWGKVSDKWDVVISSANVSEASVESFSPDDGAHVMLADENGDQASVIDHAYTVRIFEDASHEKEVSADKLKANPVSLTIDLSGESSVITSNLEKATIYHWDESCQSYKPAPNQTRDPAKKTISCDVTENGEYVVAIDDTAPDVGKFFYLDEGSPEIVAVINDFSEIANLTLEINGTAVVSGDQYSSYYDANSGIFRYPLKSNEAGDYKARLTVTDAAGNKTERVIQFTIRTTPTPSNPFTDVKESAYYFEPVLWAVNHVPQITNGTGDNTFSPEWECQRCQIVTFLWRAMGCPEPQSTKNPFVDVKSSDYFYKAVLWAVEQGITNGMDVTHFGPNLTCTRGQAVTFLWRAEGKPAPRTTRSEFTDVQNRNDYFYTPVLWAVENGITNGTGNGKFSPEMICLREQIVTFLYRDLA